MTPFKPKRKKCRNTDCRKDFMAQRPMQVVCGPRCASQLAIAKRRSAEAVQRRKERAENRAARERLKTRSDHMREAQQAFNAYIRERDFNDPCISCGRFHQGQWHAGHYRTVGGNPELRFEPKNVHKQCAPCNNHKSGDIVNYRLRLVEKIGGPAVDWLEGPHEAKKYAIDELQDLKRHYRALTRELKKQREGRGVP